VNAVLLRLRGRFLPAVVVAMGVFLIGNGLFSYTEATERAPAAYAIPTHEPLASADLNPSIAPGGAPLPSFPPNHVASRIAIPRLGIDLPIVLQTPNYGDYPLCDVAMYDPDLGQPGWGRTTYIYAHARIGMFRPLLLQSRIENGAAMLGMIVEVWTNDGWLFQYKITEVRRHTLDMNDAVTNTRERLWLQTSEGPTGTIPKLQVVADFVSVQPAPLTDANPTPHPRMCGPVYG
jgi:sortase (surface protein transpeptidase)